MRTDPAPTALFLFAHQDDEYGVFERIARCRARGLRVACAYLTDGASAKVAAATRNAESLDVLGRLGVRPEDVTFAGGLLAIPDAGLPERLAPAAAWIGRWFASFGAVDSLHVPAWEGGHHDHDALHAVAVQLAHELQWLPRVRQFPLYHGYGCIHPFFKTLAPLAANGAPETVRLGWTERLRYLRHCLRYPSQRSTWIGLFPFTLLHYLLRGVQQLQPVSLARLEEAPHPGSLYYERRHFYTWDRMRERLSSWRTDRSTGSPA